MKKTKMKYYCKRRLIEYQEPRIIYFVSETQRLWSFSLNNFGYQVISLPFVMIVRFDDRGVDNGLLFLDAKYIYMQWHFWKLRVSLSPLLQQPIEGMNDSLSKSRIIRIRLATCSETLLIHTMYFWMLCIISLFSVERHVSCHKTCLYSKG